MPQRFTAVVLMVNGIFMPSRKENDTFKLHIATALPFEPPCLVVI